MAAVVLGLCALPFILMAYATWKMITRGTRLTPQERRTPAQALIAKMYGVDE